MARACSLRVSASTSGYHSCLEAAHKADYFAGYAESIGVGRDDDGFKCLVFRQEPNAVGIGGVAFSDRFSNTQGRRVWANRKDDERGESERTG